MIIICLSIITFGVGGGGGISPPQWFYSFSGHLYFLERMFEPSLNVEYSRVFNHPLIHPVNEYDTLRVYTYFLRVSLDYPFFIRGLLLVPGIGINNIYQVQKIWIGREYFLRPFVKKGYFFRLYLGKRFDSIRIFVYYNKDQNGAYTGLCIRRVLR